MAISATLMRWVAPSASAAMVMGSRRKRWQAVHTGAPPPASATRSWAGMSVIGARPSIAMPNSGIGMAIDIAQRLHDLVEAAPDDRRRRQRLLDHRRVLEPRRGQQRHDAVV